MRKPQNQMPPATPGRNQRRTERTRERLLDAALETFLERGYDETSLGEITKRADLGTGTFYLHFQDKRGIYEAVVRRQLLLLRTQWTERRPRRAAGASGEIALMVRMVLESLLEQPRLARLILLDGPPLETWLVADIGAEMAGVLGDRVADPELCAHLVIGATLTAGRWALSASPPRATRALIARTVAFCSGGVGSDERARLARVESRAHGHRGSPF
jgi:AcrR family transcriptional regulator